MFKSESNSLPSFESSNFSEYQDFDFVGLFGFSPQVMSCLFLLKLRKRYRKTNDSKNDRIDKNYQKRQKLEISAMKCMNHEFEEN